jgi:hypothetical protein
MSLQSGMCGNTPDLAQAGRYYKMAAEQGHARAMCNLGGFYFQVRPPVPDGGARVRDTYMQGLGGFPKSIAEAVRLWRLSAEHGHAAAMYNLAECLERGVGIARVRISMVLVCRTSHALLLRCARRTWAKHSCGTSGPQHAVTSVPVKPFSACRPTRLPIRAQ